MRCPKCKKQLREGAKFCPACGAEIQKQTGRKIISVILLFVLLGGIIVAGWVAGIFFAKKNKQQENLSAVQLDSNSVSQAMNCFDQIVKDADFVTEEYLNENGFVSSEMLDEVLKALAALAQRLYQNGDITDYSFAEGDTCVYMEIDGWLSVLYTPPMEEFMSSGNEFEIITLEPNATEMYINYLTSGMKGADEAAERVSETKDIFSYTADLENSHVSIESFLNLPTNSIVIYTGHGGFNAKIGSVLFTGIVAKDNEIILQYPLEFHDKAIGINQDGKVYLTSVFFDNCVPDNAYEGNLFYLGACNSCSDPRLAQSIWDKGARAIVGNTQAVWINYNFQMTYSFFEGFTSKDADGTYLSISQALEYAKDQNGDKDPYIFGYGSEVWACYRNDCTLLDMATVSASEEPLVVKITEEPEDKENYDAYLKVANKTIESGSWTENLSMTADMKISTGSSKTTAQITMRSTSEISNYSETDLSDLKISSSASMSVMGQTYAWNMRYEDGIAHYQYTQPNQTSADMAIDPSFFNFGTMTSDMMSNAQISGNQITFTIPGDKITEVGIAAVNQMSGVDDLKYGDVDVTVTISNEGTIDTIMMVFHASLKYQGYDADVDYDIAYHFSQNATISNAPSVSIVPCSYTNQEYKYDILTVHEVNGNQIVFSVWWYRIWDISKATATLNGNVASFDYIDANYPNKQAKGAIEFSDGKAILTISECSNSYIHQEPYHFNFLAEKLNDQQLKEISRFLGVPDDLDVTIKQGTPYYWEGVGIYCTEVGIYYNGELVAGADVNSLTGGAAGGFYMYSGHA